MSFTPAMQTELRGIRATAPLRYRQWQGVVADLWHARGERGGGGHYVAPYPRIVLFLDDGWQAVDLQAQGRRMQGISALYVPAGLVLRSEIAETREFSHVDLHLDPAHLRHRLSGLTLRHDPSKPRFLKSGAGRARLDMLGGMIADEIGRPSRANLMLEGFLLATLAEVFEAEPEPESGQRGGLAPHQMAAVRARVDGRLERPLTVAEMAEAAGLSESWFAHAFKQATGQSPQRWQLGRRIEAAAVLMRRDAARPLADIAAATGFADQAHLTRAFRAEKGLPPATWRRQIVRGAAFSTEPSN